MRHVAAHLMIGPTGTLREFAGAMITARGRFAVANTLLAQRRAQRPPEELVRLIRERAGSEFTPPGLEALSAWVGPRPGSERDEV